jgi:hypothetical protein
MVNAPWYIRNNELHRDLQVNVVSSEIQRFAQKHEGRFTIMRTVRPYFSWTTRALCADYKGKTLLSYIVVK